MSDKLILEIDLTSGKTLNESWLRMFGFGIKAILKAMFGGEKIPVTVKGTKSEVENFAKTLSKEKRYMEAYHNYGLDNANTYRSKLELNKAINEFERKVGIKWPLH